jgi:secreted trypsin-like serine protease
LSRSARTVANTRSTKMNALIFVCFALPAFAFAEKRIIGGTNANIADHPWQASLRNADVHTCGAVLISATRALTAAHCGGSATTAYSILAGTSERTVQTCATCALRKPVTAIVRHPSFSNNPSAGYPNDIAVIWFNSIATNVNIAYIDLAQATDGDFVDSVCTVTGWGRQEAGGSLPTTLQEASMTVISNITCMETWSSNRIRPEQLCAVDNDVAVCGGDNGGPLVCGGLLAGVFSWGEANCSPTFPSVFVRVSSYYDWIIENM